MQWRRLAANVFLSGAARAKIRHQMAK